MVGNIGGWHSAAWRRIGLATALGAALLLGIGDSAAQAQSAGRFVVACDYSHTSHDDPIVHPGMPGHAHRHDFFGNRSTDAFSTTSSLRASPETTCSQSGDASGYWTPALFVGGTPVAPTNARIYYSGGGKDPRTIGAPPEGLAMVAGDAHATTRQPWWTTSWFCAGPYGGGYMTTAPDCPENRQVVLNVVFPDCWDGSQLDSADHKSHLTYARRGWNSTYAGCPASHPVPIPSITLKVVYPTRGAADAELASGGVNSGHGDFLDGWDRATLEGLVRDCIRAGVDCPAH